MSEGKEEEKVVLVPVANGEDSLFLFLFIVSYCEKELKYFFRLGGN